MGTGSQNRRNSPQKEWQYVRARGAVHPSTASLGTVRHPFRALPLLSSPSPAATPHRHMPNPPIPVGRPSCTAARCEAHTPRPVNPPTDREWKRRPDIPRTALQRLAKHGEPRAVWLHLEIHLHTPVRQYTPRRGLPHLACLGIPHFRDVSIRVKSRRKRDGVRMSTRDEEDSDVAILPRPRQNVAFRRQRVQILRSNLNGWTATNHHQHLGTAFVRRTRSDSST